MKKVIYIVLLLVVVSNNISFGQITLHGQYSIGTSYIESTFSSDSIDRWPNLENDRFTVNTLGLYASYPITNKISIQSGVDYRFGKMTYYTTEPNYFTLMYLPKDPPPSETFNYNSISIPIVFSYNLLKIITIRAGLNNSFRLNKLEVDGFNAENYMYEPELLFGLGVKVYKGFEIGATVHPPLRNFASLTTKYDGQDIAYSIKRDFSASIYIRYSYPLNKVKKDTEIHTEPVIIE